ncbi:MAG: ATP synthase F0 subunit B [Thermodesulfobacteriota bacterium]|nr:ATP synthase F0 subunit B [Thermodesulfobacteriota bacterium]
MLEINYTVIIQIANFLLLLFFMNIILYKPIRGIITHRNDKANSLQQMIQDFGNRSAQSERDIEESIVQARKEGYGEKEGCKVEGVEKENAILQDASSSVEEKIKFARKDLEIKMAEIRKELHGEVAGFSRQLAEKILGRSVQ